MTDRTIADVSEILGEFDINEIRKMIRLQIPSNNTESTTRSITTDYFKPLYHKYKRAIKYGDEEVSDEARIRFHDICMEIINQICTKFSLGIDESFLETHTDKLHMITMSLYSVFVLDFVRNLQTAITITIQKDIEQICELFKEIKSKKDSATIINKKMMSDTDSIIASNIYDITKWVLENIDEDTFLDIINDGDACGSIIQSMYNDGTLSGTFMNEIRTIYSNDISLRSQIGFEVVCDMRSKYKNTKKGEENNE